MHYSKSDIVKLHKKYAPSDMVYELVFTHSQIVFEIAKQLIDGGGIKLDEETVYLAAMLHDVGVYPLLDKNGDLIDGKNYITHSIEGENILKSEGFPEVIYRVASHHTGVGISKADITRFNLPLPLTDYFADSDLELIVMYADKFHSKTTPPYFNSFEWFKKDIAKFGDQKVAKFEEISRRFGVPELSYLSEKYSFNIR
ncbi:MAG TPA: HD domain-containing protein [Candidatus Saccharimonadales bacterium]